MPERRKGEIDWHDHVDQELLDLKSGLESNTTLTASAVDGVRLLDEKLELHRRQTAPVIAAIVAMQDGVRVIGKIGNAAKAIAKWSWRVARVTAPVAAAVAAVWVAFREELAPLVHWLTFWKH